MERVSALGHRFGGVGRVKVIFREGGWGLGGAESAYWMDPATYDSIPLQVPASPEQYRHFGKIVPAENADIYDGEISSWTRKSSPRP